MNTELLKEIMRSNGDTIKSLAEYLGLSTKTTSNKMRDKGTEFVLQEISAITKRYGLTSEEVTQCFFVK